MGKPKNKTKKGHQDDFEEEEVEVDILAKKSDDEEAVPVKSAGKKKKDKRKNKDWEEDDIAAELEALSMEQGLGDKDDVNGVEEKESFVVKKKEKKKKKKVQEEVDDDNEVDDLADSVSTSKPSKKDKKHVASFQMFDMLEDEGGVSSQSEDEEEEKVEKIEVKEKSKSKKKEKKNKKEPKEQKIEDIDALLAEIEKPTEKKKKGKKGKKKMEEVDESELVSTPGDVQDDEGKKVESLDEEELASKEAKVVTMEDLEMEEEDDKKRKKKGMKNKEDVAEDDVENKEDGEEGTVKTQAQKRKEKREREKLKKQQEKKKQSGKGTVKTDEGSEEATPSTEAKEEKVSDDEDGEEKGKKKKKKKGEKEEKKKTRAPVAAIREHLRKVQEEEERLKKEEEERIQKEEEEARQREEEKRLEEERKLKKKEKERRKKEELRKEGKLLTEKQKRDRQRALQLVESMKAQGLEVPTKDDSETQKKRVVYYDKKKKKRPTSEANQPTIQPTETAWFLSELSLSDKSEISLIQTRRDRKQLLKLPTPEEEVKKVEEVEAEEIKESWEDEEDLKDTWDAEDDEKESTPESEDVKEVEKKPAAKADESEDDDSEDESDESDEDDSEEESETESESEEEKTPIERARERIEKRKEEAEKNRTTDILRAPVVCVLGHVDTGKTKILDKLRRTHVQDGEAGGITQQIGATNVPKEAILDQTKMCKEFQKKEMKLPGLLIIDTPGHESFSNLRSRGSSLCDIAILVIDIMHGLEPQTIESINLLKSRKTPFIVALNKVDRLYQWRPLPTSDIENCIKKQSPNTQVEFKDRTTEVITQLAEQGLNSCLAYENKNPKEYVSLVPTSAHSGDGMGNLISLICELTQTMLAKRISYSAMLDATVMEVKALPGLGTTIDVILVNGTIHEGDTIVMAGTEGPITTQIRGLLMPQPMRELRVKSQYIKNKEVVAAQGVKIAAKDMEKALAGLPLYVAHDQNEVEFYREELSIALKEVLGSIKLTERGVFVQASTLGSLEALLEFLRTSKIPYAGINIGPVHRKDIMKASIMLEHDSQYAVILAFDVKVEREAQDMADNLGVRIFAADIIYHLFDAFTAYRDELKAQRQQEFKDIAVFPCKIRILPQYIFNSRDPIVMGVVIEAGFLKEGTPLCVPSKEVDNLGSISISVAYKPAVKDLFTILIKLTTQTNIIDQNRSKGMSVHNLNHFPLGDHRHKSHDNN
ncbi:hypothetical protein ScPMuIL_010312 [Solemya velum]